LHCLYKTRRPTIPTTPARPAPTTWVGIDAPPEEEDDDPEPAPAEDALPAAALLEAPEPEPPVVRAKVVCGLVLPVVWCPPTPPAPPVEFAVAVELPPIMVPLAPPMAEVMLDAPPATAVALARRSVWISVGRPVNQVGVCEWANCDSTMLETTPGFVCASAKREDGSAVWRTWRMETTFVDTAAEALPTEPVAETLAEAVAGTETLAEELL